MQVRHNVYKRGLNGPSELSFHINSLNIYMTPIFYISWFAYFSGNFAREQLEMESITNWFLYFLQKAIAYKEPKSGKFQILEIL
jgi:undecaprenyl pyrophosphate synthase